MKRVMCPPTYFDVQYSINPWMNVDVPVDKELAMRQWTALVRQLEELGDTIYVVEAQPGLLDMTFAGDAGLVWKDTFIPTTFRHPERAGEVAHFERWFREQGYQIRPMPPDVVFEGLGDVVFCEGLAFVGQGWRSEERAVRHLRDIVPELEILARLETVDDRYFHLAMALGFIDPSTVVYYEPAFTESSAKAIRANVENAIAVNDIDANEHFACNNLVIGSTVLLDGCTQQLRADLAAVGYDVLTCPMSEFKKSGGSLRCLVLTMM